MELLRRLSKHPLLVVLLFVSFFVGLALVIGASGMYWVGHCDLEIVFEVTDEATGKPLPGVQIAIKQGRLGYCDDRDEKEFVLETDLDGVARKQCKACMCFGYTDLFRSTWATHVPDWTYAAKAPEYESNEPAHIHVGHLATRPSGDENLAHLKVSIRLSKGLRDQ